MRSYERHDVAAHDVDRIEACAGGQWRVRRSGGVVHTPWQTRASRSIVMVSAMSAVS